MSGFSAYLRWLVTNSRQCAKLNSLAFFVSPPYQDGKEKLDQRASIFRLLPNLRCGRWRTMHLEFRRTELRAALEP